MKANRRSFLAGLTALIPALCGFMSRPPVVEIQIFALIPAAGSEDDHRTERVLILSARDTAAYQTLLALNARQISFPWDVIVYQFRDGRLVFQKKVLAE